MCEVRDELVERTGDMVEQTRDRSETLTQRLKSWQVGNLLRKIIGKDFECENWFDRYFR